MFSEPRTCQSPSLQRRISASPKHQTTQLPRSPGTVPRASAWANAKFSKHVTGQKEPLGKPIQCARLSLFAILRCSWPNEPSDIHPPNIGTAIFRKLKCCFPQITIKVFVHQFHSVIKCNEMPVYFWKGRPIWDILEGKSQILR